MKTELDLKSKVKIVNKSQFSTHKNGDIGYIVKVSKDCSFYFENGSQLSRVTGYLIGKDINDNDVVGCWEPAISLELIKQP